MRGYSDLDDTDTDLERSLAFLGTVESFEEECIVPKIFRQFEKDYNKNPSRSWLIYRYNLSNYMTTKLIRICQKRKRIGLNKV